MEKKFNTLHEIVKAARLNLSQNVWDYLVGGAETETTLKRNRQALDSIAFRPRVLNDVSDVDASTTFLGHRLRIPVLLAPIGAIQEFEEGGGASVAKAAEEFGTMNFLSSACQPGLEAVAEASTSPKVYQLYVRGDDEWVDAVIERAIAAGYSAFCLVVDLPVYSRRERDIVKRYVPATRRSQVNNDASAQMDFIYQAKLTWDKVKRIKDKYDIPLILKGIATAEDAALACEHGVDIVYVSNHGGRQLDHGRGSIEVLPEVVREVNGRAKVVVDGGFMRGTDVVKGLALGADAVGIGRLEGLAIAAGGADALVQALEILEHEIKTCMALLGVNQLEKLNPSYTCQATPIVEAHVTSAFPFLNLEDIGY